MSKASFMLFIRAMSFPQVTQPFLHLLPNESGVYVIELFTIKPTHIV